MATFAKGFLMVVVSASAIMLTTVDADAQRRDRNAQTPAPAPAPSVSRAFSTAYAPVNTAITASDWAAADAGLPALKAAAANPYEQYIAFQTEFRIATGQRNAARQLTAVDGMVDSNGAPEAERQRLNVAAGQLAYNAQQYAKAAQRVAVAQSLGSTDPDLQIMRLDALFRSDQMDAGLAYSRQLIDAARAAGSNPPDRVFGVTALALQGAQRTEDLSRILAERVNAYPTANNFRSAILSVFQSTEENRGRSIDLLRLMHAADAMNDRRFYVEHVGNLVEDALPNEALTMISAGAAANMYPASDPTFADLRSSQTAKLAEDRASLPGLERRALADPAARLATLAGDAYMSYENWAKAEQMYTAALGKTGVDAEMVNTRLGIVRFRSGNFAGALEALAQVQTGDRATIARLWEALVRSRANPAAAPAATDTPAQPAS
jgi:hypothetical protein